MEHSIWCFSKNCRYSGCIFFLKTEKTPKMLDCFLHISLKMTIKNTTLHRVYSKSKHWFTFFNQANVMEHNSENS